MLKSVNPRNFLTVLAFTASVAACSMFSGSGSSGRYSNDAAITHNLQTAIAALPVDQVNVNTSHDVVKLSGPADSVQHRAQAEEAARNVPGVQSVTNNLILQ
jgi:osmotically-inducible protein OsmY